MRKGTLFLLVVPLLLAPGTCWSQANTPNIPMGRDSNGVPWYLGPGGRPELYPVSPRTPRTTYGDIAYSKSTGRYGYAWCKETQADADRVALRDCRASDAFIGVHGTSTWLALASGSGASFGWGWSNESEARARAIALVECSRRGAEGRIQVSLHASSGPTRAEFAAQILKHERIELATAHESGYKDEATARLNIFYTAEGSSARRSKYPVGAGMTPTELRKRNAMLGGTVSLNSRMLGAMLKLAENYTFSVTEIAGGEHTAGSLHYSGVAFDVGTINGERVDEYNPYYQAFMEDCKRRGATKRLGPGDPGHDSHVHVSW